MTGISLRGIEKFAGDSVTAELTEFFEVPGMELPAIRTFIDVSDGVRLEACFRAQSPIIAALLCHPHPLYGGDMDNSVVLAMEDAFLSCGFSTLRFNFRGVGRSTGTYSEGLGERLDVIACREFLAERGIKRVWAGGYSFGAWVLTGVAAGVKEWAGMVLVSPPLDFMVFPEFPSVDFPVFIIHGSEDPFCTSPSVDKWLKDAAGYVERQALSGADHFYFGYTRALSEAIKSFVEKVVLLQT